jgi:hypothetical protein
MGFHFVRSAAASLGPANLLLLSDPLFSDLGIGAGECGVFRRTDSAFEHFPCTLARFKANAKPAFSIATRKLVKSDSEAVLFRSNESVLNPETSAMLSKLSEEFPAFRFFRVIGAEVENVSKVVGPGYLNGWVAVAVVNFTGLYWYDTSEYFPPENENITEEEFDVGAWGTKLRELLAGIASGKVEKRYVSESVPAFSGGFLRRLVGSNFVEEIARAEKDVLVFFTREGLERSRKVSAKLYKLSDRLRKAGSDTFEIWTIDIGLSQIEGGFPVSRDPAIALYPADDKTEVRLVPYESFQILVWFTAKYGTQPHEITANLTKTGKIDRAATRADQLKALTRPEVASRIKYTMDDLRADAESSYLEGGDDL